MVDVINAIRDLGRVKGASGAHFFGCDDDNEYIVKFANIGKTTVNEFVCSSLAFKINLPTPSMALINVSKSLIDSSADLAQRNIKDGIHIGFNRLPDNVCDFSQLENKTIESRSLENPGDLYGVICFDNWVLNTDRNNPGNNMVEFLPYNKMRYYIVDFGHCFTGDSWDGTLKNSKNITQLMGVFEFFRTHVNDISVFEKWFNSIEIIGDPEMDTLIDYIPDSWNLPMEEKTVLNDIIKYRRGLIRQIIINNKNQLGV
jgi:hypothetical protein